MAKSDKKGQTDPDNITKRPMSGFMYFIKEFRKSNSVEDKGVSAIAKAAGDKWKSMSESERQPFQDQALADRQRYERDIASGKVTASKKSKGKKQKNKKEKDPNKPKKATTAYLYFLQDFRKTCKETGKAVMSVASDKWKNLTADEKDKFVKLELADKERYKKEMASYVPSPASKKTKAAKKPVAKKPVELSDESDEESGSDVESDVSSD